MNIELGIMAIKHETKYLDSDCFTESHEVLRDC